MTPRTPPLAVLATLLLNLALLAPAVPAGAEGLPGFPLGSPGWDCFGGDAGNTYDNASWFYQPFGGFPGNACPGQLLPVLDEEDWYRFAAREGTWISAFVSTNLGDADLCVFGPSDREVPLDCSTEPLYYGDSVSLVARERGDYRVQIYLATGAAAYTFSLSISPPPPLLLPDVAVLDLVVEKPVLRTDLLDTGVVNPLGAWKLTTRVGNLGPGWTCPEVAFSIVAEPLVPQTTVWPLYIPAFQINGYAEPAWVPCLSPGETTELSVDWRPGLVVGDVEVVAQARAEYDANEENNEKRVKTFVLIGGL